MFTATTCHSSLSRAGIVFLACFHHKRTYTKHTRIHLIQQMFEGISKLWESARMVDIYFHDKPLNAGTAAYHFLVTVDKFE